MSDSQKSLVYAYFWLMIFPFELVASTSCPGNDTIAISTPHPNFVAREVDGFVEVHAEHTVSQQAIEVSTWGCVEEAQNSDDRADLKATRSMDASLSPESWTTVTGSPFAAGRDRVDAETGNVPDAEASEVRDQGPMNILLLYADDWRHDTLGVAGNPIVQTPTLDQLAREGIRFTHNCVTTSICGISRATLFTGQ